MGHSVRTTQPGVLYLTELADLAATFKDAVCQRAQLITYAFFANNCS